MYDSDSKDHARTVLTKYADSTIYTLTTYGRGETDYVRAFVISDYGLLEITWHIACLLDSKVKPKAGIPMGGGQLSKGLEVASFARTLIGRKLNQLDHWKEI